MTQHDDFGQAFLKQMYDLQGQYLSSLKPLFETGSSADPLQQLWQQWSGQGFNAGNPFAAFNPAPAQSPFSLWTQATTPSMDDVYRNMNEQMLKLLQAPFQAGAGSAPWTSAAPGFTESMQQWFPQMPGAQLDELMQTVQEYQRTTLEVNQLMASLVQDAMARMQQQLSAMEDFDPSRMSTWWTEITQSVLNEAKAEQTYQDLQQRLAEVQAQLMAAGEQYRETVAYSLGLATQKQMQALQHEIEQLRRQVQSQQQAAADTIDAVADDFTVLNGIGAKFNQKLHAQGIRNLQQLASMSDEMLQNLDSELQAKGKVFQDQWREQAERILNTMTGKGNGK